jgi:hypothetical protein
MLPVDHTAGNLIAGSINWSCLLPDSMELWLVEGWGLLPEYDDVSWKEKT